VDTLRRLPSVHQLLEQPAGQVLIERHGRAIVLFAVQRALEQERESGPARHDDDRWAGIQRHIDELRRPRLRTVINATGVILHTNLGRAPLAQTAATAAAAVATRYSSLELDLKTGKRGLRHDLVSELLCHLTGAEAAAVVNNCAAATLLILSALGKGKEVIVSRGELIEIGGAFRMPEIMRLSGVRMVEVGTTNRTRVQDYEAAITPRTAAILKVHTSNFAVVGFTESAQIPPLAELARRHGVLLLHDLGSGALAEIGSLGLTDEPRIAESLQAGSDLVVCSADKLLGGPQGGLILGRAALVARALKHPLARAVRVDKMTLAALAATLDLYLSGRIELLPVWRMLAVGADALEARARRWASRLTDSGVQVEVRPGLSAVGGGSLPAERLNTTLVALTGSRPGASRLLDRLRTADPPVIARIEKDCVVLDPRTVLDDEDEPLLLAVVSATR
jgi:L-seryl-tRNA(Ser) seleniumtransferase